MTMLVIGLCVSLLLLVLSLEPVGFEKRYATPNLYIPVVAVILFLMYLKFVSVDEGTGDCIRLDLGILLLFLFPIVSLGVVRWIIFLYLLMKKQLNQTGLAKKLQMIILYPMLLIEIVMSLN